MTNKIQILSHPHAGSSLLKTMIGRCHDTVCVDGESTAVFNPVKDKTNVSKYASFGPETSWKPLRDHKTVILIRDPRYSLISLTDRYEGSEIPSDHVRFFRMDYWEWYLEQYRIGDKANHYLRYQDLFNPFELVGMMFSLGLDWSGNLYEQYERKLYQDREIPTERPDPTNHLDYRQWQINEKIQNMDDPAKLANYPGLVDFFKKIERNHNYRKIFSA